MIRTIDRIDRLPNNKLLLSIGDESYSFYYSEIKGFRPEEGCEIDESTYAKLMEILRLRGLRYAVRLLEAGDYSCAMLKNKLRMKKYPADICDNILELLTDKGYVDDLRFAHNYCSLKADSYGIMRLREGLYSKGIDSDIISEVLPEYEENQDVQAIISRYAQRRSFCPDTADAKEKDKFCRYLAGKGIAYSDIKSYFSQSL